MNKPVKIFVFGSCRSSIGKYVDNNNYKVIHNFGYTHTTKEVLMYLDLFDKKYNISDIKYNNCLINEPLKFNADTYNNWFKEAEIIIIEISSLKLVENDNIYYQLNYATINGNLSNFNITIQNEEIFNIDIKEIYRRINKHIIFIPNINLNFYDVPNINGYVKDRILLEERMVKYCNIYILTSQIFKDYDYHEICDCSKSIDTNHYTILGYDIISKSIINIIDNIFTLKPFYQL